MTDRRKKSPIVRLLVVLAASLLMAVNIKVFVKNGGLYPGGMSGLSLLLQRVFLQFFGMNIPYTFLNVVLNAIPVYIGFRFIGRRFTTFSIVMVLSNSMLVDILPTYMITYDTLLISVFGGILNGMAISLCLFADATSGGTDFISIYLSQKRGIDSFNIILCFNVVILVSAGLLFGWDKALYSIIFQYVSTQTIHLLYRNYQQVTMFVVTEKPELIAKAIYEVSHHGATIMSAKGSHEETEKPVVYSVIDAPEVKHLVKIVRDLDPGAFVNTIKTKEIRGNFYYSPKD